MKKYSLANTDLEVSRMAYGTWHIGGSWDQTPLTDDLIGRADALLKTAVEHGINFIDLADIYTMGKSDEVVGHVLANNSDLRDKVYLQAKCGIILGQDPVRGGPGRYDFSYDHIVQATETTIKRLQTEYVDLLVLHRPDPLVQPEEVARVFDYLQSSGKVRYFGVSNHTPGQIELLKTAVDQPLVVNQVELNIMHNHLINEGIVANTHAATYVGAAGTLDYCRINKIMIQAWSPVAGGKIFNPPADAPDNIKAVGQLIAELAEKYNTNQSAIAFAWLLRHPAGIQPIIGTLNPARLAESCAADAVELSRKDWYRLLAAANGAGVP